MRDWNGPSLFSGGQFGTDWRGWQGGDDRRLVMAGRELIPVGVKRHHSFTPPPVMPMTMYFWKINVISTGGSEAITPPVAIIP